MPCCLCPEGTCTPDCPFLEVFPVEAPFKTVEELADTGFNLEFIKGCLLQAKTPDEQKIIIEGMIISCEARKKYPLEGDAGLVRELQEVQAKNMKLMKKLQERFKLREEAAAAPAPAANDDDK